LKVSIPVPCDEALVRATDALEAQGFGVLTTIDVKATLKGKLDRDFRRYLILGACTPPLTGGDVLERFAHEHDGLIVGRRLVHALCFFGFTSRMLKPHPCRDQHERHGEHAAQDEIRNHLSPSSAGEDADRESDRQQRGDAEVDVPLSVVLEEAEQTDRQPTRSRPSVGSGRIAACHLADLHLR
jgi:hypothetical protein